MRTPRQTRSGMALFMVLVALALLSVIAVEILYSSRVDSRISRNLKERLQAQYLAQSAARLSLLRLHLYKTARDATNSNAQAKDMFKSVLNQVWSIPLPQMPFASMTQVTWPGTISANITSEGSKIPINLLDGNVNRESSEDVSKAVFGNVETLIRGMLEEDEEGGFGNKYRDLNVAELIGNLKDWLDSDLNKPDGTEETYDYEKLDYKPRNGRIPVLSEIHMVRGWNEELYNKIAKPHFSVLNSSSAIDPNFVSLDRLKAYHPALTSEDLAVIEKRRFEQPFTSIDELAEFIANSGEVKNGRGFSFGANPPEKKEVEDTFYINASGKVGETVRSYRIGVRFTYVATKPKTGEEPPSTNYMDEKKKAGAKFDKLYVVSIEELI
ncbi:MAG TPA: PilX N-terminal domain-containing pilus assembly protein [Bdellovibrionota bacterium]|nr:PilX N-terminal domain-containing pilus assembly protein [Bdellovibrionota bacterium]